MKKNTLFLKCKVRWLKPKALFLILFCAFLPFIEGNAQTCTVMTTNFSEDFDVLPLGSSTNPSISNCWGYIDEIVSTGYGYTQGAYSQSPRQSFYMYRTNSTANQLQNLILVSPETNNLGNGSKQLRFSVRTYSTSYLNKLEIITLNSQNSATNATVIATIYKNDATFQEYIIPLPQTTDSHFGFRLAYNGTTTGSGIVIDDIYYEDISSCFYPANIEVTDIDLTTATISWDAQTNATGYSYEVRSSGGAGSGSTGLDASGTVTGSTTANVSGLTPGVNYLVYVRSICGTSNGIWTSFPVSFQTLCPVFINNFYENFDTSIPGSTTVATHPNCWNIIDDIVSTGYGYILNSTSYAKSTPHSFVLYRTNSAANASQDLVLVSPETDNLGSGTKQLRFSAKTYSTTSSGNYINKLEIITIDSNTSTANATVIATIYKDDANYQEYIVPLPNTSHDYFGFRLAYNGTTSASYIAIDDVYFENMSSCAPPMNIDITNITTNSATISWDPSATLNVSGYSYEVRSSGGPGSGTIGLDASGTVTNTTTTNVSGLNSGTEYTVYVRSICGAGTKLEALGDWTSIPGKFGTLCEVIRNNFSENFDTSTLGSTAVATYPHCWSYIDNITSTGYGYVINYTLNARSGQQYFRLYRSNSTANASQDLVLVSPETDNLGNGTKQLRFSVRTVSASYINKLEIITLDSKTSTANATVLTTITPSQLTYQEFIVPLPQTTHDYFGFRLAYNETTTISEVLIDDVHYEDLTPCIYPMNIDVNNIDPTTGSATISWDPSAASDVTSYEYEVRTFGDPGSGSRGLIAGGTTSGISENITGLSSCANYTIYVRSICGSSPGSWNPSAKVFDTPIGVVIGNLFEGFENTRLGASNNNTVPYCWTYLSGATTHYGYTTTSAAQNGNNGFYAYRTLASDGDLLLISPETDNLGNGSKQLRFSAKVTSASYATTHKFEIYTMDGNTSSANRTLLRGNIPLTAEWQEFVIRLPQTTDDYFAFSFDRTNTTIIYLDDIFYEETPLHTLSSTTADNVCNGGSQGTIMVSSQGGLPPFTYSWSPNVSNNFIASNLPAGEYEVTVTDSFNRQVKETITIKEPDPININLTVKNISCNGNNNGSATVSPSNGVAPYKILWSTGAITRSISSLSKGLYSVTVTDANGCTFEEDFEIEEPNIFSVSIGSQTNVSNYGGSDGSATVSVTGGTAPYSYSWSPSGGTSATASNLTAGSYTVTVTDNNNCKAYLTFTITEPAAPLDITLISQNNITCSGFNNGSIEVNVTGGIPPYSYSWSPSGGTSTTASNLTAGLYTVTVTDSNGQSMFQQYTITEPDALKVSVGSIINIVCNGQNSGAATAVVTGGTPPYTYRWSNGATTQTVNNLSAGSNFVYITDSNGCTIQESFTITEPDAIAINTTNIKNVSCNGQADGTITISVNGGIAPYTYSWNNGQTGTSLSNLSGGIYTVIVTDGNGCTESKIFTISEPTFVYPPVAVNQNFCSSNNPQLSDIVITGTNIQWYDTATGGNLLPLTTALTNGTTYYASQTVNGCESTSRTAVQVSLYQSTPLTSTNKTVCYNSVIQDVTIDGFNYTQLKWYSSPSAPAALPGTTLLTTGTYYVSSFTNGVCESARQAVQITVAQSVPAPVVTPQQVCGSGHTLDDLTVGTAAGATLIWYASAQASTPLPGTAQALSGTYYVEQVVGTCKSVRVAVSVQVIPVTSPAMTDLTTCSGTTIADFNAQVAPTKYVWYINNTTTTPLAETTLISSGTFYIAEEVSGCISNRALVDVVVNQRPNSPTGQTVQNVYAGDTVADLKMNQQGVVWFGSEADALAFTKQLPSNTPLVHNKKYYGVLVGGNNCASLPTEVEVRITLSTNDLDLAYLKYYPNPTDSELNISYIETITKVEIFNIAGQRVLSKEFDANEVKVDLSGFGSGTYMVRIETETASQFVKVVKK